MKLFQRRREASSQSAAIQMIEGSLSTVGIQSEVGREQEGEALYWHFPWELAHVCLTLYPPADEAVGGLAICATLMTLPEGSALPLYRRLLDLNGTALIECGFGLDRDLVVLNSECLWAELTESRVVRLLGYACQAIDKHGAGLVGEFGCVPARDLD
jgi:hypothetical protein